MKAVCSSRDWLFIYNARIKIEHLKNKGIHLNGDGVKSKDQSRKTQAKAEPSLVASTNSEQDNSDLVGKLDSEGHFTYGSSTFNADLLSELSKNRGFKLAALNITSIPGHIGELRIYMNTKCIDILAVNETRLDDTISSGEVTVPGYALERNDRNRDGGGVALYIRNTINYERLFDLECGSLEWIGIKVIKPKP